MYVAFVVYFEVVIFVSCSSSLDSSMEAVEFIVLGIFKFKIFALYVRHSDGEQLYK